MEKADYLGTLIRQGIHEPALVGRHKNLAMFHKGRDVIVKAEAHGKVRERLAFISGQDRAIQIKSYQRRGTIVCEGASESEQLAGAAGLKISTA